ncbi:MAG: DUF3267 domain-containing protein [Anaerolineae bacterium]
MQEKRVVDKTMTFLAANLWGAVLAVAITPLFFAVFIFFWGALSIPLHWGWLQIGLSLLVLLISIGIHELLHGLGFFLGGAEWSQIEFGLRKLTPYAHCSVPLKRNSYRWSAALPGIVLGVIPVVLGTIVGSTTVLLFGTFMTVSAAGDALILWLLRDAPADALVFDHPTKVGCELHLNE